MSECLITEFVSRVQDNVQGRATSSSEAIANNNLALCQAVIQSLSFELGLICLPTVQRSECNAEGYILGLRRLLACNGIRRFEEVF